MAKKSAPKVIVQPTEDQKLYKVSVVTAGLTYDAEAPTLHEALEQVKIETFKGKATLQVTYDGKVRHVLVPPLMLRRLIRPQNRQFLEKRLLILLS